MEVFDFADFVEVELGVLGGLVVVRFDEFFHVAAHDGRVEAAEMGSLEGVGADVKIPRVRDDYCLWLGVSICGGW